MAITPNPDPEPNPVPPSRPQSGTRPARALIGWMDPDSAHLALNESRVGVLVAPDLVERAQHARDAVKGRVGALSQTDVVRPAPPELADHVAALMASPPASPFQAEGWEVAVVDLSQVVALQPVVHTDHGVERVEIARADDICAIAAITLPLPSDGELPAQFDPTQRAWLISSANPNLRILGAWAGQVEPGVVAFGVGVALWPSYMQVAHFRGRYILRDGYHRALAFLQRGISKVPAFVRKFEPFDDLGVPAGLLSPAVYLGDRPPVLTDYLDDDVAANVVVPAVQKFVVVNGMELNSADSHRELRQTPQ